ncbi:hypothetical protein QUT06_22605, partial [Xanthomonas citri pv. citri]
GIRWKPVRLKSRNQLSAIALRLGRFRPDISMRHHRATSFAQAGRIRFQACRDSIHVRYLTAAQPEHVRGAGSPLFVGTSIYIFGARDGGYR